jgi:hypothetical protein
MATQPALIQPQPHSPHSPTALSSVCLWDRLPNESAQAYAKFTNYRLLPPGQRSLAKVGVSHNLASRWSRLYSWPARAAAWDDYALTSADALGLRGAIEARIKHNELGLKFAQKAIDAVDKVKVKSVDALIDLAKAGVAIQREALALTSKVESNEPNFSVQVMNVTSDSRNIIQAPARRKTYQEISGTRLSGIKVSKRELKESNEP